MRNYFLIALLSLIFFACQQDASSNLKPLNLLEYDIPITIMAPDSAEVKTMDLLVQKDVTIKSGDDYFVQIFVSDAVTTDTKKIVAELMAEVKKNRYFSKIIKENPEGFIYQTAIDSTHTSYGFRQVRVQGDREFIFQTGLIGTFDQQQVENMYEAVKPVKQ